MKNYLLRYGEISLKGNNRSFFERKLVHNLKCYLKSKGVTGTIQRLRNRLYAETADEVDWMPVFGLISYSPCLKIEGSYEAIQNEVEKACAEFNEKTTFRITSHVLDPQYSMSKQEMNEKLGAFVIQKTKAKVSLKKYEKEIGIEIVQGKAYIYSQTNPCLGGLPVGVEGSVLLLIENEKSLLAGLLAMKRGCALFPLSEKKLDIQRLEKYAHGTKPKLKLLSEIDLPAFITEYELQALVVGDTMANIQKYGDFSLPVLMPLIGCTEKKIQEEQKRYP